MELNYKYVELNPLEFYHYRKFLNEVTKKSLPDKALREDELKFALDNIKTWNSLKKDNDTNVKHDDNKYKTLDSVRTSKGKAQVYSSCYYKCPECDARLYQMEKLYARNIVCRFLRHLAFAHTNRSEDLMPSERYMHKNTNNVHNGHSYLLKDGDEGYIKCGLSNGEYIFEPKDDETYEKILYFSCIEDIGRSSGETSKLAQDKNKFKSSQYINVNDITYNQSLLLDALYYNNDTYVCEDLLELYKKLPHNKHNESFDTIDYQKEKIDLSNKIMKIYKKLLDIYKDSNYTIKKNDRDMPINYLINILNKQQKTLRDIAEQKLRIYQSLTSNDYNEAFELEDDIKNTKNELKYCFENNESFDNKSSMQEMAIIMTTLFDYNDGKFSSKYGPCRVCSPITINENIKGKKVKHTFEPDFLLNIDGKKIIIEVDGIWHREDRTNKYDYTRKKSDVIRECLLNSKGYCILHIDDLNDIVKISKDKFNIHDIYNNISSLDKIKSLKFSIEYGIKKIVEGKNLYDSYLIKFNGEKFERKGMSPEYNIIGGKTVGEYNLKIHEK